MHPKTIQNSPVYPLLLELLPDGTLNAFKTDWSPPEHISGTAQITALFHTIEEKLNSQDFSARSEAGRALQAVIQEIQSVTEGLGETGYGEGWKNHLNTLWNDIGKSANEEYKAEKNTVPSEMQKLELETIAGLATYMQRLPDFCSRQSAILEETCALLAKNNELKNLVDGVDIAIKMLQRASESQQRVDIVNRCHTLQELEPLQDDGTAASYASYRQREAEDGAIRKLVESVFTRTLLPVINGLRDGLRSVKESSHTELAGVYEKILDEFDEHLEGLFSLKKIHLSEGDPMRFEYSVPQGSVKAEHPNQIDTIATIMRDGYVFSGKPIQEAWVTVFVE